MKYISLLALTVALFGITACETVKGSAKDVQIVGKNIGAVATGDVVPPYDEEGNPQLSIGPMPKGYDYADNPAGHLHAASNTKGVDLYYPNTGERAGYGTHSELSMPSYSGGINASNNSVTIYPLNQEMQNIFQGQAPIYNNTGTTINQDFMPQSYLPPLPDMGMSGGDQIYFRHGSSNLGEGDLKKLSAVAKTINGYITVEGYASRPTQKGEQSVQASILNLKESMNRSFAVSSTLLKKGVPAENIKTVSYGSARASGNSEQDRRVDIIAGY